SVAVSNVEVMVAKAAYISGIAARVILSNASTRPTITKLFHRQPRSMREVARFKLGFSQNLLTRVIDFCAPARMDGCGSIHPYSVSGAIGVIPRSITVSGWISTA